MNESPSSPSGRLPDPPPGTASTRPPPPPGEQLDRPVLAAPLSAPEDSAKNPRGWTSGRGRKIQLGVFATLVVATTSVAVIVAAGSRSGRTHDISGQFVVVSLDNEGCGQMGSDAAGKMDHLNALEAGRTFPCSEGP